jgi:hypothetical protein
LEERKWRSVVGERERNNFFEVCSSSSIFLSANLRSVSFPHDVMFEILGKSKLPIPWSGMSGFSNF